MIEKKKAIELFCKSLSTEELACKYYDALDEIDRLRSDPNNVYVQIPVNRLAEAIPDVIEVEPVTPACMPSRLYLTIAERDVIARELCHKLHPYRRKENNNE